MRIISNPNSKEEKTLTCETCQCVFAYLPGDVSVESWNNGKIGPGYSGWRKKYVTCPNCGTKIEVGRKPGEEEKIEVINRYDELEDILPHLPIEDGDSFFNNLIEEQ